MFDFMCIVQYRQLTNQCYSIIYKFIMLRMIWRKSWIATPLLCNSIIWILPMRPLVLSSLTNSSDYLLHLYKVIIFNTIYSKMGFISLFQTVSIESRSMMCIQKSIYSNSMTQILQNQEHSSIVCIIQQAIFTFIPLPTYNTNFEQ
jgi:hypothetical protein